jgi:hypothetical protein
MSESAFGIRLELLKMAKEMLEHDYYTRKDAENQLWQFKCEIARQKGEELPSALHIPYPSTVDILAKAKELNRFISEKQ